MRRSGFTMIELVCIIVILSILSALAVPAFVDLRQQALKVSLASHAGSFRTAVQFGHLTWRVYGHASLVDNLPGFGDGTVDFNNAGYPIDGTAQGNSGGAMNNNIPNNNNGDLRCRRLFEALLIGTAEACGGTGGQGVPCDSQMFRAARNGANTCRYSLLDEPGTYFEYRVLDGGISVAGF